MSGEYHYETRLLHMTPDDAVHAIAGWLARIVADVRRANQWMDPAWKPRRKLATRLVVFHAPPVFATTRGATYTLSPSNVADWNVRTTV